MKHREEYPRFVGQFHFQPKKEGYIGIERERFLKSSNGKYLPRAQEFLDKIRDKQWTYELSACQVEDRTRPEKDLAGIKLELLRNDNRGHACARKLGINLATEEVALLSMPLDVFPDSRYQKIIATIPEYQLRAACRVAGTHIHVGMKNMTQAIAVYNALIPYLDHFIHAGNHSSGMRLALYKTMAAHWRPPHYWSFEEFFLTALKEGFYENPRNCWHLIRISRHGTVEIRAFGVTENLEEILDWVEQIRAVLRRRGVFSWDHAR